jgi:hypothetical protein
VDYHPEPISTADVRLSSEIQQLTELLAKNTHDVWARQRFAEGWRFGPRRDDQAKQHPGLVPYEQLSESEKEYDRGTALATLKAVLSLGYRIEKSGATGNRGPAQMSAAASGPSAAPASSSKDSLLPWDPATLAEETGERPAFHHPQVEAIRRRVEMFNGDAAELLKMHPGAAVQSKRELLSEAEEASLPAAAKVVLERYAVADRLAMRYRRKSSHAFRDLFIGAFLAMTAFEFAGHGFHGEVGHLARPILLGLYLILWGVAAMRWSVAFAGDYQNRHLDYRALAEGLRVQFFWRLLGIPDQVEDHYLGQQRSELEWIRYALRKWRALDDETFPPAGQEHSDFLDLARRRWVRGQLEYFTRAAPAEEVRGRKCRRDGKAFFAVNIIAVVGLLVIPLVEKVYSHDESGHVAFALAEGVTFVVAGLSLVVAALRIAYAEKMAFAEHAKEFEAIRQLCENAENQLAAGESHEPFRELGQEALSENGDWLLTHRERPLEVPIP